MKIYKNMFKISSISLACLALLTATSCLDDLDTEPIDPTVVTAGQFLTDENSALQLLAGVYSNFTLPSQTGPTDSNISGLDAGSSTFSRTMWNLQELSTDEAVWSYENDPGIPDLQRNVWNDSNEFISGMFGRNALSLTLANDFLRSSEGLSINNIDVMRAEARFLRALAYYYFMDLYGKAPFVTELDPVDPTFQPPVAERQQLFDYIESEINEILPSLSAIGQGPYARADQGAAYMLLAKIYLNAEVYIGENRYSECVAACNSLINSGAYTLNPNYAFNFTSDNNLSNEIILGLPSDGLLSQSFGSTTIILNGEVGSIEGNGDEIGVNGFGGAMRLRKQISEILEVPAAGDRNTLKTAGRTISVTSIADRDSGYTHAKYKNITSQGVPGSDRTFADTDFPLFRYADVLLMYAEAVKRGGTGGSESQAVQFINDLRNRANAPTIGATELTLLFLIDERGRELFWEGHRRQDLIRFGRFTGGTYNWEWKGDTPNGSSIPDFLKIYPIPARSLATNPNLTQNTGY